jgi:hypothetical protein
LLKATRRYALRSWTVVWQKTPESSLDPRNANGPIPFTSSALLGLAYVRLHLHLGPHRSLETRDKHRIASSLLRSPPVRRSHRILPAILYAVHAVSLPVRLGIESVGRSQAFFWSIRHGLSSLECAILLAKWLIAMHSTQSTTEISSKYTLISCHHSSPVVPMLNAGLELRWILKLTLK